MSEFSFHQGKVSSGILAATGAALKYLVSPLVVVFILSWFAGQENFDTGIFRVNEIIFAAVALGTFITILSFFRGFYPRGSRSRALFGVISVAFVILWLWFITLGGKLSIDIGPGGGAIDFSGLLYLFIFAASLRAMYFVVEMFSYRQEYVNNAQMHLGKATA